MQEKQDSSMEFYTIEEIARELGVATTSVRSWIVEGLVKAHKVHQSFVISQAEKNRIMKAFKDYSAAYAKPYKRALRDALSGNDVVYDKAVELGRLFYEYGDRSYSYERWLMISRRLPQVIGRGLLTGYLKAKEDAITKS